MDRKCAEEAEIAADYDSIGQLNGATRPIAFKATVAAAAASPLRHLASWIGRSSLKELMKSADLDQQRATFYGLA